MSELKDVPAGMEIVYDEDSDQFEMTLEGTYCVVDPLTAQIIVNLLNKVAELEAENKRLRERLESSIELTPEQMAALKEQTE